MDSAMDLAQFCANYLATGCVAPEDCGRANIAGDDDMVNNRDFAEFAEYWQNLTTGVFYNCVECVSVCPVGA